MDEKGTVPIYMPDDTVVGRAAISNDGHTILIHIPEGTALQGLISENLIGMSVIYMTNDARDQVVEGSENAQ